MWYGVDALAEKDPNIGGYVYCVGNPVKLVDTDGYDINPFPYFNGISLNFGGMLRDQLIGIKNACYASYSYSPNRNQEGKVIVDNNKQAVEHYYTISGDGFWDIFGGEDKKKDQMEN